MVRLLVCGGRTIKDRKLIYDGLYAFCDENGLWTEPYSDGNRLPCNLTVIAGAANGVDRLAADWCAINWVPLIEFPADWEHLGHAAGSVRNQQMLDEGKPDFVLAFPAGSSVGTWDMVRRAKKAKVPVRIIRA